MNLRVAAATCVMNSFRCRKRYERDSQLLLPVSLGPLGDCLLSRGTPSDSPFVAVRRSPRQVTLETALRFCRGLAAVRADVPADSVLTADAGRDTGDRQEWVPHIGESTAVQLRLWPHGDPFGLPCCCFSRDLVDQQEARPISDYQHSELRSDATAEYSGAIGIHHVSVRDSKVVPHHIAVENNVNQQIELAVSVECEKRDRSSGYGDHLVRIILVGHFHEPPYRPAVLPL